MAAMFLPLVLNMIYRPSGGLPGTMAICSILLAIFVIFRHKENIIRIANREEKKFSFKKSVPTNKENEAENDENDSSDADESK
jgi:hypothetical protein